jgi:hypothetical protein
MTSESLDDFRTLRAYSISSLEADREGVLAPAGAGWISGLLGFSGRDATTVVARANRAKQEARARKSEASRCGSWLSPSKSLRANSVAGGL